VNGAMGCTGHDAESTGCLGCRALPCEDGICFAMPGPSVKVNRLLEIWNQQDVGRLCDYF
jgi:hypothetical protein